MYPYHNKAKQLIKQGHLTHWEQVDKWNQIEKALVLYFDNHRPVPIRPYRQEEYFKILEDIKNSGDPSTLKKHCHDNEFSH